MTQTKRQTFILSAQVCGYNVFFIICTLHELTKLVLPVYMCREQKALL